MMMMMMMMMIKSTLKEFLEADPSHIVQLERE